MIPHDFFRLWIKMRWQNHSGRLASKHGNWSCMQKWISTKNDAIYQQESGNNDEHWGSFRPTIDRPKMDFVKVYVVCFLVDMFCSCHYCTMSHRVVSPSYGQINRMGYVGSKKWDCLQTGCTKKNGGLWLFSHCDGRRTLGIEPMDMGKAIIMVPWHGLNCFMLESPLIAAVKCLFFVCPISIDIPWCANDIQMFPGKLATRHVWWSNPLKTSSMTNFSFFSGYTSQLCLIN